MRTRDKGIKYTTSKVYFDTDYNTKVKLTVQIRLNDECGNGHSDFAITGDGVNLDGKTRWDRELYGGCCHDIIAKIFPEFKCFIDLHLNNYLGLPMYSFANGVYFIKQQNDKAIREHFCYATEEELNEIKKLTHETPLKLYLHEIGYIQRCKDNADKAREYLEELCGEKWVNPHLNDLSRVETGAITEEDRVFMSKYSSATPLDVVCKMYFQNKYAPSSEQINSINNEIDNAIKGVTRKLEIERKARLAVAEVTSNKNYIYYQHSNTININWRSYEDLITGEQLDMILTKLSSIEGLTVKVGDDK